MNRYKHIFLHLLLVLLPLLMALAPARAQNTVYAGQPSVLSVIEVPGDTYSWELYSDTTGINFATSPGNCQPADAYFIGSSSGPSVNVMWLTQGVYFYKVTAYRGNCTMNLKIGMTTVLNNLPTAVIEPPQPICAGDSVHLTITLTGIAPWSITLSDGTNSNVFNNIMASPFTLTVPTPPVATTSYLVTEVTDAYVTNNVPSAPVVQVVNQKPINSRIYKYGNK